MTAPGEPLPATYGEHLMSVDSDVLGVVGCPLVESSVRAMAVVVLDVFLEQGSELWRVPDDGSVEEFVTQLSLIHI